MDRVHAWMEGKALPIRLFHEKALALIGDFDLG